MSWEQYAPTSESQLGRLSRLKAACGGDEAEAAVRRKSQQLPTPIQKLGDSAKPAGIAALYKESYGGRGAGAVAFEGVAGGGEDELGESARQHGAQLREYVQTCQSFVADIERAVHLLDTIAHQQEQVCCARAGIVYVVMRRSCYLVYRRRSLEVTLRRDAMAVCDRVYADMLIQQLVSPHSGVLLPQSSTPHAHL